MLGGCRGVVCKVGVWDIFFVGAASRGYVFVFINVCIACGCICIKQEILKFFQEFIS